MTTGVPVASRTCRRPMWKVSSAPSVRPKKAGAPGSAARERSRSARAAPRRSEAHASTPASTTAPAAVRISVRQSSARARCARSAARTGSVGVAVTVVSVDVADTVGGRYAGTCPTSPPPGHFRGDARVPVSDDGGLGRMRGMPDSMLAGRLNVRTKHFEVTEVPRPTPGPGQVLVEVRAAGICLSDVHLIEGQLTPLFLQGDEVTLGHEVAGVVAGLGEGVTGRQPGERVTLQAGEEVDGWIHTRGVDYDGGWAQYAPA